ncbi:hypothetical protein [Streptomyces sp. 7N604]|uniref:hypothetical protein n=1 Tax=Streptomyces sp. 7N604 TaxID=3457415 RepID=UPI003FD1AE43
MHSRGARPDLAGLVRDAIALLMGLITGRPANPPFHDDPLRNLASLREMLALKPTRLHVGHGTALDPDRVRHWADKEDHRLHKRAAKGRLPRRTEPASSHTQPTTDHDEAPSLRPPYD